MVGCMFWQISYPFESSRLDALLFALADIHYEPFFITAMI
jgi:hypothetical protein